MMQREPATVLPVPGVYALVNKQRKYAYITHTVNLQKRSHSMSHMLLQADKKPKSAYWAIAELPRHPSDEYTFIVLAQNVLKRDAAGAILTAQRSFRAKGYTLIEGNRAAQMVTLTLGAVPAVMTLTEALKASNSKVKYLTAWRRIERGWSVEQALGLADPDPRWDTRKRAERKTRATA